MATGRKAGRRMKGQESLLNLSAIVIVTSILFLYFFYVTQSQKVESSSLYATQLKYKYAENALVNMYYVNAEGTGYTYSDVVARGAADEEYRAEAVAGCKAYLDSVLADYDYYLMVEDGSENKIFDVNVVPGEGVDFASHMAMMPALPGEDSVYAYLYVW